VADAPEPLAHNVDAIYRAARDQKVYAGATFSKEPNQGQRGHAFSNA
jgi:hypothetical protein